MKSSRLENMDFGAHSLLSPKEQTLTTNCCSPPYVIERNSSKISSSFSVPMSPIIIQQMKTTTQLPLPTEAYEM